MRSRYKFILIGVGIAVITLSIFSFMSQESELRTLGGFTFCEPKEDQQKSNRTLVDHITWTKDYCLKIEDFQGEPDFTNEYPALTHWRLKGYSIPEAHVNENGTMQLIFTEIEVVAFFNMKESWFRSEGLTEIDKLTLLRNEQGHFDLAEEHAGFLETTLREQLIGKPFDIPDEIPKTEFAFKIQSNKLFEKFYYEIYNMDFLQDEYDRITDHGKKHKEQVEFNLRFDKLRE